MSAEFHDPEWHIGCKVVLPDRRGINVLGTLPGLLTKYFGLEAHPVLLPFGRGTHDATVFFDSIEPNHDEAIREAGAFVLAVTRQLPEKPDILLHASHYMLCLGSPNNTALFDAMPDCSSLIVPPQREAC